LPELISMLLRDWWPWFWTQIGVAGPPLAVPDAYRTEAGVPLNVPLTAGVLSNDVEPDGTPMGVILISGPRSGQLSLNPDGSFQYTPEPGFNGMVRFTYQVSDFSQMSGEVTVTIAVGLQGDYDGSGVVDQLDYVVWRAGFGSTTNLRADGNGDGRVDIVDYVVWRIAFTAAQAAAAVIDSTAESAAVSGALYAESFLTAAKSADLKAMAFADSGFLDSFVSAWRMPPRLEYDAAFEAI
jgi:hypothetical protein